uniref:Elicitin n=1 Tax=Peronospora matthiolae TaxID=2874970 RepID=A0AAV1U1V3_9STRA
MVRLSALVLLMLIGSGIVFTNAKPCSTKELSVFNEVSGQVNKCVQDSKLNFQIPPRSSLLMAQQSALCKSDACKDMIGAMDDLDIPNCEAVFDKKNMTLQRSLDTFVSSCDTTTPSPSPIKRRKSLESSSSEGSDVGSKKTRDINPATAVPFGTAHQLVVLLVVGVLSLGLVLP